MIVCICIFQKENKGSFKIKTANKKISFLAIKK